jgi:hypothetical protein
MLNAQCEELAGHGGFADTLECLIAAAELRSPPQQAGMTELRCLHGFGAGCLKCLQYQQATGTAVADCNMLTKFRLAGIGPMSAAKDCLDFGLARTGFHGCLRLFRYPRSFGAFKFECSPCCFRILRSFFGLETEEGGCWARRGR